MVLESDVVTAAKNAAADGESPDVDRRRALRPARRAASSSRARNVSEVEVDETTAGFY